MASPIRFCGFNKRLTPAPGTEDKVGVLHVHSNGHETISCWKLTPEELAHVNKTGEVWQSIMAGQSAPPSYISGLPLMEAMDPDSGQATVYESDGSHVVKDAEYFATLHHADQMYGKKPYTYHLGGVVAILRRWGADWPFLAAGWLHDIIEDCLKHLTVDERKETIDERFGTLIGAMVWACTGTQDTREACFAEQMAKINAFPAAAIPKCADRLFNMCSAVEDATADPTPRLIKLCRTYAAEYPTFRAAVEPHVPAEVVQELDAAFTLLQQFLSTQAD